MAKRKEPKEVKEKRRKTTPAKRTKPSKGRLYFTRVNEDAIVAYAKSTDFVEKQKLYNELIDPVFTELIDKIVYTYKFASLPNIDELKLECKAYLTTILNKFDQTKGNKAFSYYSVVTKNWFVHKVKRNIKQIKREVYLEDVSKEADFITLSEDNPYIQDRISEEFWESLWSHIEAWEKLDLKDNEDKVLKAVRILLENADEIPIFNKKAVYLYLREITGLNTKQVVNNLNKIRGKYKDFRQEWDDGEV